MHSVGKHVLYTQSFILFAIQLRISVLYSFYLEFMTDFPIAPMSDQECMMMLVATGSSSALLTAIHGVSPTALPCD